MQPGTGHTPRMEATEKSMTSQGWDIIRPIMDQMGPETLLASGPQQPEVTLDIDGWPTIVTDILVEHGKVETLRTSGSRDTLLYDEEGFPTCFELEKDSFVLPTRKRKAVLAKTKQPAKHCKTGGACGCPKCRWSETGCKKCRGYS